MLARLFDHLRWADRKVLESLRTARNAPPKALEIYAHVLGAEHVWLSRLERRPATIAVWPSLSLDECEAIGADTAEAYRRLVSELDPLTLEKQLTYQNSAGATFTSMVGDILTHVAMHGSYHRGQVAMLLRTAGDTPPATDYIVFVRGSPAPTRTNQ
jgi:uncharacterized damage-inducible protein DinB